MPDESPRYRYFERPYQFSTYSVEPKPCDLCGQERPGFDGPLQWRGRCRARLRSVPGRRAPRRRGQQPYHELGEDYLHRRAPESRAKRLVRQRTHLGFEVHLHAQQTIAPNGAAPALAGGS